METVEWKAFSRSIVCAKTILKQARGQSIDGLIEQWRPNMEAVRVTIELYGAREGYRITKASAEEDEAEEQRHEDALSSLMNEELASCLSNALWPVRCRSRDVRRWSCPADARPLEAIQLAVLLAGTGIPEIALNFLTM
jgi:hypothetical protein